MAQIEVAFECEDCNAQFDEMDDGGLCSVCDLYICEECQPNHAVIHCFEDCNAVLDTKGKKK